MRTVRWFVDQQAQERPDQTYLIAPEPALGVTFSELREGSRALAGALSRTGLSKGDRVAFMLDNGFQTVQIFLGVMYAGLSITPLHPQAQIAHLIHILEQSGSRLVFVSPRYRAKMQQVMAQLPGPLTLKEVNIDSKVSPLPAVSGALAPIDPNDEAQLIYTSGTTGLPKGVLLSHQNLIAGAQNTAGAHQLTPQDRALCILPLCHINAQVVTLLGPLVSGGSVVVPHRFRVSHFWRWAADFQCTWLSVVPTVVAYLLARTTPDSEGLSEALERLRFARSASAPLPPVHLKEFEDRFGLPLVETLGLTETAAPILANPLPPQSRKAGSAGLPYGNEVAVVDPDGNELAPEEIGEILVRGPNVTLGYHKLPDITHRVLGPDGWLRTGDLGFRDGDGYYFITGRLKELIIKGGENIAPREIDDLLCRHPAVLEAACLGIADSEYGEEIVVCLVLKPGECCLDKGLAPTLERCSLSLGEGGCPLADGLRELCQTTLGAFKTPKLFLALDALPRGPSGKLQRLKLKLIFEEAAGNALLGSEAKEKS